MTRAKVLAILGGAGILLVAVVAIFMWALSHFADESYNPED